MCCRLADTSYPIFFSVGLDYEILMIKGTADSGIEFDIPDILSLLDGEVEAPPSGYYELKSKAVVGRWVVSLYRSRWLHDIYSYISPVNMETGLENIPHLHSIYRKVENGMSFVINVVFS